jgi:hypothetical protein
MRRAQASAERWELRTSSGRVIRVRERKYDTFVRGEYVTFDHEDNVIIQEFYAGRADTSQGLPRLCSLARVVTLSRLSVHGP